MKLELTKDEASTLRSALLIALAETDGSRATKLPKAAERFRAMLDKLEKSRGGMPVMKIGGGR